jgi:hypothetical protein
MVIQLRDIISTFTSVDTSNPLVKYLMLSDRECAQVVKSMEEFSDKGTSEKSAGVSEPFHTECFSKKYFELMPTELSIHPPNLL